MGLLKILIYVLVVLLPLIIAGIAIPFTDQPFIYDIGRGAALIGFMILMLQPILASRFKAIEHSFGFDILIRFHRNMALIATGLLIAHPILLTSVHGFSLIYSLDVPWQVYFGKGALLLLLINAVLSYFFLPGKIKFERWRILHDLIGPFILLFIFIHSFFLGHDLVQSATLRGLWIAIITIAVVAFIYHRIIRPRLLARHPFEVLDVKRETAGVHSVKLAPPKEKYLYSYHPGQFHFLTFLRGRGLPTEEHHWTISSSPTEEGFVQSTIKVLGDFTATIKETKPGDQAVVHGPFGRFSYTFHPQEKKLIFIAGGIGITPIRSMLKNMKDTGSSKDVLLFYANKKFEDIVFYHELEDIEKGLHPNLKVVHVLKQAPDGWTGEIGRIDENMLRKYIQEDKSENGYYLCGPPGLITASINNLKSMGVEDKSIHTEIFSFLD